MSSKGRNLRVLPPWMLLPSILPLVDQALAMPGWASTLFSSCWFSLVRSSLTTMREPFSLKRCLMTRSLSSRRANLTMMPGGLSPAVPGGANRCAARMFSSVMPWMPSLVVIRLRTSRLQFSSGLVGKPKILMQPRREYCSLELADS